MSSGENHPPRGIPRALSGGSVKFGPFVLEARIAVGGTAEVYIGRPIDPSAPASWRIDGPGGRPRKIVVKRLLPHFAADAEGRTMFEREAALHASVRHANVVEVYGSGTADGEPWLAMEYVDGCDLYRLLRRLAGDPARKLAPSVAVHVARGVLAGLASVHGARDAAGQPMAIIHRDVTPSNVYLSNDGAVKLGDFGIARSAARATMRSGGGAMLKGKFAYLSPEQIAGEPFDQRADLFSMAVVLSEMLLGKPLFAGSGQLAVLLAIRDCRIDSLREARSSLPKGLFEVLERALARDPAQRFATAAALSAALAPFDPTPEASGAEVAALVRWVQSAPSAEQIQSVRESAGKIRAAVAAREEPKDEAPRDSERTTGEYAPIPSSVITGAGSRLGPWAFARLVEAIATGQVSRGDQVDYMGRGFAPIESIEELARFLPASTATTNPVRSVGAPDFSDDVSPGALLAVMLRVLETDGTGVLFADGQTESRRSPGTEPPQAGGGGGRKEIYFVGGKLHHVASNNASELLGEFLVRRGTISREELDFALAVLPRYGGRMGDTLVSLGLVPSLDVFRAIREQGRDRIVDLFQWRAGKLTFYTGHTAPHVEFPLELDVASLMLAGLEAARPGDAPLAAYRTRLDEILGPATTIRPKLRAVAWPPIVRRLFEVTDEPRPLREVLALVTQGGRFTANEVLRALEVLLVGKLLAWQ